MMFGSELTFIKSRYLKPVIYICYTITDTQTVAKALDCSLRSVVFEKSMSQCSEEANLQASVLLPINAETELVFAGNTSTRVLS